jgi:hypothetical protein
LVPPFPFLLIEAAEGSHFFSVRSQFGRCARPALKRLNSFTDFSQCVLRAARPAFIVWLTNR